MVKICISLITWVKLMIRFEYELIVGQLEVHQNYNGVLVGFDYYFHFGP
jgi:hypothetical protein